MPRPALLIPALLSVAACAGGAGGGADYQLTITPVLPRNQGSLPSTLDRMELLINSGSADPLVYDLDSVSTGDSSTFNNMPALDQAVIELRGYIGNTLTAYGRTESQDLSTGTIDVRVLLGEIDQFAELSPLPDPLAFGALAAGGDGRFLLFGGNPDGVFGDSDSASASIYAIDVAPAADNLLFEELDLKMPPRDDGGAGRICHTATRLTRGDHDQVGKILVAGGAGAFMLEQDSAYTPDMSTVTWTAFLYDPDTDTIDELTEAQALVQPRCGHTATELPNGDVVLVGGLGSGSFSVQQSAEIYNPVIGGFEYITGTATSPMLFHAAAAMGDTAVLVCGGLQQSGSAFVASDACDLVSTSGTITGVAPLPQAVVHPAMATLPDGRILLTGGATPSGSSTLFDFPAEVSDLAWIFDGTSWTDTDHMSIPRAMHSMVTLPDGNVLVSGGVTEISGFWNMYYGSESAVPCAELYDTDTERFGVIGDCDQTAALGPLTLPTAHATVALDPDFGVLVAGGLNPDESAASGVSLYIPSP